MKGCKLTEEDLDAMAEAEEFEEKVKRIIDIFGDAENV